MAGTGTAFKIEGHVLTATSHSVTEWVKNSRPGTRLDPRVFDKQCSEAREALAVAVSLTEMVEAGQLTALYKVVAPNGELAEPDFNNLQDIPAELVIPGTLNLFDTAKADIVPIFLVR